MASKESVNENRKNLNYDELDLYSKLDVKLKARNKITKIILIFNCKCITETYYININVYSYEVPVVDNNIISYNVDPLKRCHKYVISSSCVNNSSLYNCIDYILSK